jgi:hypothetical protein
MIWWNLVNVDVQEYRQNGFFIFIDGCLYVSSFAEGLISKRLPGTGIARLSKPHLYHALTYVHTYNRRTCLMKKWKMRKRQSSFAQRFLSSLYTYPRPEIP